MKYSLKIDDHTYEVEIPDLQARPVVAIVDGQMVEVWPENEARVRPAASIKVINPEAETQGPPAPPRPGSGSPPPAGPEASAVLAPAMLAPIPGVIVAILVKEGEQVVYGQGLCIIEAMKMRNTIKSARPGKIAAMRVSPGQTVNYHDVLMEYGE